MKLKHALIGIAAVGGIALTSSAASAAMSVTYMASMNTSTSTAVRGRTAAGTEATPRTSMTRALRRKPRKKVDADGNVNSR